MNILLCIFLCLGIVIEIIYLIEKKQIFKNIDYKAKYDLLKLSNKELLDNTTDLKSALAAANKRIETNDKALKLLRKIPTAVKRQFGIFENNSKKK